MAERKKILITGATGFLGKRVGAFAQKDFDVVSFGSEIDIRNPESLNVFHNEKFDWVIHCAGKVFVPDSWKDPKSFYDVNVNGTMHVLEFCRKQNIGCTLISAYVYGSPAELPIKESHSVQPSNPYAWSKFMAEDLGKMYHSCFQLPINIVRPFNIYGPGQPSHFVLPTILNQAILQNEIEILDGEPKRDFIHVDDVAKLILATVGNREFNVFNACSGESHSVNEIIQLIAGALNKEVKILDKKDRRKNEIMDTKGSYIHAKQVLGWSPSISIGEGINNLIQGLK